ncbi:MAG: sugar transferase [Parcubacteria group bacterium]|nr:sugar transferase [Parcubacteria group bacterium]
MKKSELFFTAILVPLDFLMLLCAGLGAYFLRINPWVSEYRPVLFSLNLPFGRYFSLIIIISVFLLIVFALVGLYRIKSIRPLLNDFFKIIIGISAGIIILVFYTFLQREWFDSRFLILAGWAIAIVSVCFGRFLINQWQKYLMKKHHFGANRVLVIGQDGISEKIIKNIKKQPNLGYQLAGSLAGVDINKIKIKFKKQGLDEIILADLNWPKGKVLELVDFCEENHLIFKFVPNLFQTLTANTSFETLGTIPLIEIKRTALDGWGKIIKRFIDFIVAFFGLILLSPFFMLIAFIIKGGSPGPVLVKLKRISRNKEFDLYKFRSMVEDAEAMKKSLRKHNEREDGPLFKIKNDPRVTKVGRILRKYRIDELPQLINVLSGEMSLIGPRPHQPDEIAQYQKHHKKVLAIKAGMTGFAQASGSSDLPFEEEIKLDTYYVENWSLLMDLKIFFKTGIVLLRDRSAC